jgi:hypothetical protein
MITMPINPKMHSRKKRNLDIRRDSMESFRWTVSAGSAHENDGDEPKLVFRRNIVTNTAFSCYC